MRNTVPSSIVVPIFLHRVLEGVVADREALGGRPQLGVFGAGPRVLLDGGDFVDLDNGIAVLVVTGDDPADIHGHKVFLVFVPARLLSYRQRLEQSHYRRARRLLARISVRFLRARASSRFIRARASRCLRALRRRHRPQRQFEMPMTLRR